MSVKLSNLFSKSIDVGEDTISDNKKIVDAKCITDTNFISTDDWWYPSKK